MQSTGYRLPGGDLTPSPRLHTNMSPSTAVWSAYAVRQKHLRNKFFVWTKIWELLLDAPFVLTRIYKPTSSERFVFEVNRCCLY